MVIASGPGGGYDAYGRILARYLEKHIPGNPTVVSQNMAGAAGIIATNWTYNVAPKDGTVILATYNALLAQPLFGDPAVQYDVQKFEMIGSFSKQQQICVTWHTSPIKSIQQATERDVITASTGAAGNSATMPKVLNAMLGTKFKLVIGYGTTEQRLALERGEAESICGLSWSTLKASNADWVNNKRINILVQTGSKPQSDLPDVPVLLNLVKSPEDKKVISFLGFPEDLGRPFVMPPGTPKELVAAVRQGFDAALKDPQLKEDADKQMLEIDPVNGDEMARIIKDAYATPKDLVKRAAELSGVEVR
jgi:tripartite-type tricarboxylate transporter receptor subunit TctC